MATPIGIQLKQRIATPSTATKTNHKPVKVTGILHFTENQRGEGVMSRHGAGLDGSPGLVVFPNRFKNAPQDTGWQLVSYDVNQDSRQAFAYLVTNQGQIRDAIKDLRTQLRDTPEGAIFFANDEDIVAVAMVYFSPNGDGSLDGYYSQGNYGETGIKVVPDGNTVVPVQEGWNLVVLYENPDNHRTLIAEPALDDQTINEAICGLTDQLAGLQPSKQTSKQRQPIAAAQQR